MNPPATHYKYLAPKPKSSYRQLCIKGRSIFARTLYGLYKSAEEPRTPEQIAVDYQLPLEAVLEAIAYCDWNPPEIALDFAEEKALMEAAGMNDPNYKHHPQPKPIPPEVREQIRKEIWG
jgi:uncharacterized protein (DUF433 family)